MATMVRMDGAGAVGGAMQCGARGGQAGDGHSKDPSGGREGHMGQDARNEEQQRSVLGFCLLFDKLHLPQRCLSKQQLPPNAFTCTACDVANAWQTCGR